MSATLRPARGADAPFVAEVLLAASRGHLPRGPWDFALPDTADRDAVLAQLAGGIDPSWCHHAIFRVAEADGVAGSALCAFEAGESDDAQLSKAFGAAIAARGWAPERMAAIGPALAPYLACFPKFPPGTWIVENVGTRPALRRRGLVARLLDDALERGRARGAEVAQISCLVGNDAAQRAYEKAGFRVVETRTDPAFESRFGAPGFSRLTVRL
jgi:translation initiation factor 4G